MSMPYTPQRKRGRKLGVKIEAINRIFRGLPKSHKTAQYYRALGEAAGIKPETLDRACSVALSLIEGAS